MKALPEILKDYMSPEKSFLVNFGSKTIKPIRISLPKAPKYELIDGYGLPAHQQVFKRKEFPQALIALEKQAYDHFKAKKINNNYEIQEYFWENLKARSKELKEEIKFMKHFIWHMHNGYWCFIDGQPTYIPGWHFSYLHLHHMTLEKGEGYPEFSIRQNRRFLFREYIYNTTETFADVDEKGKAIKVDGKYRMKDIGTRTFFGTIEPKGRREGLTNEFCHIITRIMTETYGADNIGTIVSMDGDNAETHFKQKLLPAFRRWPIWLKPIWKGGVIDIVFDLPKGTYDPSIKVLGCTLNFTASGSDTSNDGKKLMAAGFDEQGKGKRQGNVGNRWQINKETMSLNAGSKILGFCIHPSTVEKMDEGGQDYKEMCDMSDFYTRGAAGQTISGLAVSFMPTSFCMRGFNDKFGKPVLLSPSKRQKALGYPLDIGSQTYIARKRLELYDEKDAKKMDEFRSFVRKFPESYEDCWKGVAGFIGFPIEQIETQLTAIEAKPMWAKGRLEWINRTRFGSVEFIHDPEGPWEVSFIPDKNKANLKTSMEYYSAMEDAYIPMMRPLYPGFGIVGVDPHEFNNKGESQMLGGKMSKLSDTGITVVQKRDKRVDTNDFDKKSWTTQRAIATLEKRFASNIEVAEEALKAAILWGCLIHLERNKSEVWSKIIEWKYGGYLNHNAEILPSGQLQIDPMPGSFMSPVVKKRAFSLAKDQLVNHVHIEQLPSLLKQAKEISSMEELTKYDKLASWLNALVGVESIYSEVMGYGDEEEIMSLGLIGRAV